MKVMRSLLSGLKANQKSPLSKFNVEEVVFEPRESLKSPILGSGFFSRVLAVF